jgi:FkbM family methyltransferase
MISKLFGKLASPLFGTGIGQLPGMWSIYRHVWKQIRPSGDNPVPVFDGRLYLDSHDYVMASQIYSTGKWEPYETELFLRTIDSNMIVVDIGANIGYYTLLAALNKATVISFEPVPATYRILARNIALNNLENVTAHEKAVSNTNGNVSLCLASDPASCGISGHGKSIEVDSVTLDSVVDRVDVIKMDIEGAEALALEGMRNTLRTNRHLVLFTEVCDSALKGAGSSARDYVSSLFQWFNVKAMLESHRKLVYCSTVEDVMETMKHKTLINLLCTRRNK